MMQFGGKIINSGGFGCINYPPIPCYNQKTKKYERDEGDRVSKLMKKREASIEMKNISKISLIDQEGAFTLEDILDCHPNKFSDEIDGLSKCKIIKKKDIMDIKCQSPMEKETCAMTIQPEGKVKYGAFTMPMIDHTLEDLMRYKSMNRMNTGLRMIEQMYYAIAILSQNGMLHFDIKEDNIGIDLNGKPVLFDLGISFSFTVGKDIPMKDYMDMHPRINQSPDLLVYGFTNSCGLGESDRSDIRPYMNDIKEWISTPRDIVIDLTLSEVKKVYSKNELLWMDNYVVGVSNMIRAIYGSLDKMNIKDKKWLGDDTFALHK